MRSVEIRWPGGQTQTINNPQIDQVHDHQREIISMLSSFPLTRQTGRHIVASLIIVLLTLSPALAQQKADPPGTPQRSPQSMGVSTGTAVVSATRRTVGIVDAKAPFVFEDVTARTALASFKHRSGSSAERLYRRDDFGRRRYLRLRRRRSARYLPRQRLDHRRDAGQRESAARRALSTTWAIGSLKM